MKTQITNAQVAAELHKLAAALEQKPEALCTKPTLYFNCCYENEGKELFLRLASSLPHPLIKEADNNYYRLRYKSEALWIDVEVERSKVCVLVEEAKEAIWECPSLLSASEASEFEEKEG